MKYPLAIALLATALPLAASAEDPAPPSQIDYAGFINLTGEVAGFRQQRLVSLAEFKEKASQEGVFVLDARTPSAFAMGHIDGAVNLPFTDFTTERLKEVIGEDTDREILIYCNNNFSDDAAPVKTKLAPLALNIPTFINLYGYGYKNIYELAGSYSMKDPEIDWVSNSESKPL